MASSSLLFYYSVSALTDQITKDESSSTKKSSTSEPFLIGSFPQNLEVLWAYKSCKNHKSFKVKIINFFEIPVLNNM